LVKRLKNRYSVCKNITKSAGVESLFYNVESPETALASIDGNAGMALGNAYGSNICNIALILGVSALINPIRVHSTVLRKAQRVAYTYAGHHSYRGPSRRP
jgi:cation:H+ antiporter